MRGDGIVPVMEVGNNNSGFGGYGAQTADKDDVLGFELREQNREQVAKWIVEKDVEDDTDVLNGIAYDQQTKRIFLTGKRWNKLFEVEIIKR